MQNTAMGLSHTTHSDRSFGSLLIRVISFLTTACLNAMLLIEPAAASRNETDLLALLAFKDQISSDPNGVLSSWNDSVHFCMWAGVTCSRRHPQRVTALNLAVQSLEGSLSANVANLSFLRTIDLSLNSLHGQIPAEIGRLFRLRHLNLSFNSFNGEIPENVTHCLELIDIDLHANALVGGIPLQLGSLSKLQLLFLSRNSLTGHIPPTLGNLSSLTVLRLSKNRLTRNIPVGLGRLQKLRTLRLSTNRLSGTIPSSLYNSSSLVMFEVGANHLHGTLAPDLGLALPNLISFSVANNRFTGPMPVSLTNFSRIEELEFSRNNFTGAVPMNLGRLQGLRWFNVEFNQLGGEKDDELICFITSLTNCSYLESLSIAYNHVSSLLPPSMSNLSSHLRTMYLGGNRIFGSIPWGIENLVTLTSLGLEGNLLTGSIPFHLGKLQELEEVNLNHNRLSGGIPSSLGNLTKLYGLDLEGNDLQGTIPSDLGKCQLLNELFLSQNNLNGTIPIQVLNIFPLRVLSMNANSLTGALPMEVGGLKNLQYLDVSNNKFSGHIPSTLAACVALEYLYLHDDSFDGGIPPLSALRGVQELDLSRNNLSGQIPKYLVEFPFLLHLNLSFNNLEGDVPKLGIFKNMTAFSIDGNEKLCGGIEELQLPPCSMKAPKKQSKILSLKVIIVIVLVVVSVFVLSCLLAIRYWLKRSSKKPASLPSVRRHFRDITYAELLKATDGFSAVNLIGAGTFGLVYKGILDQTGETVAIKVFKLQQLRASKSFIVECNALRRIRHLNIVKILTVCSSIDFEGNDFKALVFDYMPNGSLDAWLHPSANEHQQLKILTFDQRLNIAIHVACALDYLHHHCQEPVVHCDLKPSNVLLDANMVAHVGDFGLARIFSKDVIICSETQASSIGIKGSVGYVAPEYGMGAEVSTYGDVYSYGILLLEIFTGKRPTDDMFKNNLTLHQFAKMSLPGRIMEIIDCCLLSKVTEVISDNGDHNEMRNRIFECLLSLVRLGVSCSTDAPKERINMQDVVLRLHEVRDFYLGVGKFKAKDPRNSSLLEGPSYISAY